MQQEITDDLGALIEVVPPTLQQSLHDLNQEDELLEVVLDLGRLPEARFLDREVILSSIEVTEADIQYVASRIGRFGDDNRAGIERTLHRISAIRNREDKIVGLTCRVGRAVYGTIDIIRDIVEPGNSVLLLGRPGVGKTTMLREVARVLAKKKRVVIVDTSNEIGGDGDIPHPSIGKARRMQVKTPNMQHAVMIEAVENHMPEVIIIDEIGTELEAAAARTIAERGVQLVATAHGNTLDNLMMNPTLADLVGGIQSVTLSDEEARRRRTRKSILERKAPPTFDVVVEIQDWERVAVRPDVAEAVDAILEGRFLPPEIRFKDEEGKTHIEEMQLPGLEEEEVEYPPAKEKAMRQRPLAIYPYGISQHRLQQVAKNLKVPIQIVDDLADAEVVFTLKNYYRKRPHNISEAEKKGIPIYVLRSNTVTQMESCLAEIFGVPLNPDPLAAAGEETQHAIERVLSGAHSAELAPQNAYIRRYQHEMARQANLYSRSKGKEPNRRVRIYPKKWLES
ncbi:MAG: AAA family ATPase [Anaerolineae bacterium]|nr:AAA family ATPase [Anaerolineae bacterium]